MAGRSKYSPESRERSIRVARDAERSIADVARDLGIHPETLRVWVRQAEADEGTRTDRLSPLSHASNLPLELGKYVPRKPQNMRRRKEGWKCPISLILKTCLRLV